MLSGTVLFAGCSWMGGEAVGQILTSRHPRVHMEYAKNGREALQVQGLLRPEIVFMGMRLADMTGEHLICEMRRDVARPFIIACADRLSETEHRKIMQMGANEIMQDPVDAVKMEALIEKQLARRGMVSGRGMAERSLQRLFAEAGVPFDLKGYRYLEYALGLLESGDMQLDSIGALYERIGEKYGCVAASVERNIRYAIAQCADRNERLNGMGNKQFISKLLSEREANAGGMYNPRVSVFCSGRRVFK